MLRGGAEINSIDDVGATPLMHGLAFDQTPGIVSLLLSAGADVRMQDHEGRTPLMLAAMRSRSVEVIDLLLGGASDLYAKDKEGHTAYFHAAINDKGRDVMRRVFKAYEEETRRETRQFWSEEQGESLSIGGVDAGQRTSSNNDIVPGFDDEKDNEFRIRLQKIDEVEGCIVFYLSGYLDGLTSTLFQKRVLKATENGFIKLIFHAFGCYDEPDYGTATYTAFLKAIKPRGGDLVLLQIRPEVYDVYQALGFSQFLNIKASLSEAVDFFVKKDMKGDQASFPIIFECPICSRKLKASGSGRFRCSECRTILAIDGAGQVYLG